MTSITEEFFAMAQKLRHQRSVIITNHKHHVRFPCHKNARYSPDLYHFSRHFWHQQSHRRLCFIIDRNAIAVIGDGHGIRCFAHDSFPVMNDFPLLRAFHQDFRSNEEVNVEISIVSHGFNVVPLFWRNTANCPASIRIT